MRSTKPLCYFYQSVYDPQKLSSVLTAISGESRLTCIVSYGAHSQESTVPLLSHVPDTEQYGNANSHSLSCHKYSTAGALFVLPHAPEYHAGSAAVSHTRSLVFLRKHIGGPHFDIEAIWDEHTFFEFEARSVAKTMGTMVVCRLIFLEVATTSNPPQAEPYVNHVPTVSIGAKPRFPMIETLDVIDDRRCREGRAFSLLSRPLYLLVGTLIQIFYKTTKLVTSIPQEPK